MPLAVLEAMLEGACPVVSDVVGNNDIAMHMKTSALFPLENTTIAAEIIITLTINKRRVIGRNARVTVIEKYSVHRMAGETTDVYTNSLSI